VSADSPLNSAANLLQQSRGAADNTAPGVAIATSGGVLKGYELAPEGTDSSLAEALQKLKVSFEKAVKIDKGIVNDKFFTVKRVEGVDYMLVPANYIKMLEMDEWKVIHSLLAVNGTPFKLTLDKMSIQAPNEEVRLFFASCINRVDIPENVTALNFTGTSPQERGRAYIDVLAARKYSGIVALDGYLPAGVKTPSGGSYLTHYLSLLGGASGVKALNSLPEILTKILRKALEANEERWISVTSSTLVSYGEAVHQNLRFHRIKRRDLKTNVVSEVTVPTHLNRPSQMIQAIWTIEKHQLKSLEGPWDELKTLGERYQKGVPLGSIIKVQELHKAAYSETFKQNDRLVSWRSRRNAAIKNALNYARGKPKRNQEHEFTKKSIDEVKGFFVNIVCELFGKTENVLEDFKALSPLMLIRELKNASVGLDISIEKWYDVLGSLRVESDKIKVKPESAVILQSVIEDLDPGLIESNYLDPSAQRAESDEG
jgi:hypothetical protein